MNKKWINFTTRDDGTESGPVDVSHMNPGSHPISLCWYSLTYHASRPGAWRMASRNIMCRCNWSTRCHILPVVLRNSTRWLSARRSTQHRAAESRDFRSWLWSKLPIIFLYSSGGIIWQELRGANNGRSGGKCEDKELKDIWVKYNERRRWQRDATCTSSWYDHVWLHLLTTACPTPGSSRSDLWIRFAGQCEGPSLAKYVHG